MRKLLLALLLAPLFAAPARAEEGLVTFKSMTVDLALALARAALADCQKQGYQVSVAVVDRFGVHASAAARPLRRRPYRADRDRQGLDRGQLPHQHQRTGRRHADPARRRPACALCRARPLSPAA